MPEDLKIATYESVDQLPAGCLDLMMLAGGDCFFLSPDWFRTLERHGTAPGQRPRYYVVSDPSGAALAILPMIHEATPRFARPRVLKSFSNFYTMDFAPLLSGARDREAMAALARALLAEKPAFDVIDIRMLTAGSAPEGELRAAFAQTGTMTDSFFQFDNWIHKLAGQSAADYYAARPSRLKNTIRRKRKKFEETHKLSFLLVTGPENLEKAIADYQSIYAKSWKEGESFPDFIPSLMRACADAGILRLGVIYGDDKPVAAQLWMIYSNTAMIYKLAYDEDYAALSAGSILSKHMMDHAIDVDHVEILDYGVGNDSYKRDWMTIRREKTGILVYNRTVMGLAAAAHHFLGKQIRRITKPAKAQAIEAEPSSTAE